MKKLSGFFILVVVVLAGAGARSVKAYVTAKSISAAGTIVPHKWDPSTFPIAWQMDPVQGANVTGSRTQADVLTQSFQAWQSVVPVSLKLVNTVSPTPQPNKYDGYNVITTNGSAGSLPAGVLALTYTFFYDQGGGVDKFGRPVQFAGQILEADMVFSSSDTFSLNPTAVSNQIDFQSVATHEAGHFLGMDHASNVSSTMFWTTGPGLIFPRNLSADDIAGISTLYPPASFASKGALSGTVRTTANAPVFGAIVVAVNSSGTPVASSVTDPSGNYLIQGLDPGSYTVFAEPLSGRITSGNVSTLLNVYPSSTVNTGFTTRYH